MLLFWPWYFQIEIDLLENKKLTEGNTDSGCHHDPVRGQTVGRCLLFFAPSRGAQLIQRFYVVSIVLIVVKIFPGHQAYLDYRSDKQKIEEDLIAKRYAEDRYCCVSRCLLQRLHKYQTIIHPPKAMHELLI